MSIAVSRWVYFKRLKGLADSLGFQSVETLFSYPADDVETWFACEEIWKKWNDKQANDSVRRK